MHSRNVAPPPLRALAAAACRRVVNCFNIIAIDGFPLEAIGRGALRQMFDCNTFFQAHGHRVLIVLADVNYRQLPHAGEIHRLVDDPLVGRAVAEKTYRRLRSSHGFWQRAPHRSRSGRCRRRCRCCRGSRSPYRPCASCRRGLWNNRRRVPYTRRDSVYKSAPLAIK